MKDDEMPKSIRLVVRDGQLCGSWYYTDAAIAPYETEQVYAPVGNDLAGAGAASVSPTSNREPHPYQEHPIYPDYCAFAVGDEDYCKREQDNAIHNPASAPPSAAAVDAARDVCSHLFATVFHPSGQGGLSESQEAEIAAIITKHLPPVTPSVPSAAPDTALERRHVIDLIERFQREPKRAQGTKNALEWLRRQIAEGNHTYHKFEPPVTGFGKPEECYRCGLLGNALMHLLARDGSGEVEEQG